ncbi:hypothetical protein G7085_07350 [Tessaracoccus sp. HDW20]|uniref:hypothetical protein n=1 Tax=Tessaracoccus coleopterorum TaxID=2714950 RepID=UPI0018D40074|nr:hypothetical protein [Tessaracoccus coleopterorum]NHB84486.1 hypothetical protein [Tessaracoccus coleopterorum]
MLQVPANRLPFVGELLQVRADEARWTGAIERVLGNFARTLIIPARHQRAASEYIDREHLFTRLVYEFVEPDRLGVPQFEAEQLPGKLELADGEYTGWLAQRLQHRFMYACVADVAGLRDRERAVTVNGQVRHSQGLHEKDDRSRVDDRSRWVLGFSTRAKEADLEARIAEAEAKVAEIDAELTRWDDERAEVKTRADALRDLARFTWEQIDVAAHDQRIAGVERRLEQLRERNVDLAAMEAALRRAEAAKVAADAQLRDLNVEQQRHADGVARLEKEAEASSATWHRPPSSLTTWLPSSRGRRPGSPRATSMPGCATGSTGATRSSRRRWPAPRSRPCGSWTASGPAGPPLRPTGTARASICPSSSPGWESWRPTGSPTSRTASSTCSTARPATTSAASPRRSAAPAPRSAAGSTTSTAPSC